MADNARFIGAVSSTPETDEYAVIELYSGVVDILTVLQHFSISAEVGELLLIDRVYKQLATPIAPSRAKDPKDIEKIAKTHLRGGSLPNVEGIRIASLFSEEMSEAGHYVKFKPDCNPCILPLKIVRYHNAIITTREPNKMIYCVSLEWEEIKTK